MDAQQHDFTDAKQRLEQIAEAVARDDMPLDDALDLFEEAVALGMQISDALETDLDESEVVEVQAEQAAQEQAAVEQPASPAQN